MGRKDGRKTCKDALFKIMERCQQIERSIMTTYRKGIWSRFIKGVKEY